MMKTGSKRKINPVLRNIFDILIRVIEVNWRRKWLMKIVEITARWLKLLLMKRVHQ